MISSARSFPDRKHLSNAEGHWLRVVLIGLVGYLFLIAGYAQQSALRSVTGTAKARVDVVTDVLKISFDTEGGTVVRTVFLKTPAKGGFPQNAVLLDESPNRIYVAQTGLIGGAFPNHKTAMTVSGERVLNDGANELVVKFESPDFSGIKLVKTYTFKRGSYAVRVKHDVLNIGTVPVSPMLYLQLVRDGNREAPDQRSSYDTFTGPAIFTDTKKYQRVEFSDIERGKADIEKISPYGYVAMVQHYFATAWLLPDGVIRENFVRKVDANLYAVGMITSLKDIAPGTIKSVEARLFIGPREESLTRPLRLDALQDDGWVLNVLQKLKR